MTLDEQISFCEEKSKNIKLKAEPQTFVDIKNSLEKLKELRGGENEPCCRCDGNHTNADRIRNMSDEELARIWLKVTDVRVERLQEITSEQICREGVEVEYPHVLNGEEKRYAFSTLWNSTIKKSDLDRYGWDANPWVWIIEFERCEKPEE